LREAENYSSEMGEVLRSWDVADGDMAVVINGRVSACFYLLRFLQDSKLILVVGTLGYWSIQGR
jgi:hypothetical protein